MAFIDNLKKAWKEGEITREEITNVLAITPIGATAKVGRVAIGGLEKAITGKGAAVAGDKVLLEAIGAYTKKAGKAAVNTKTMDLSKKVLMRAGFTAGAAGLVVSVSGTYPFAAFLKEETLQQLDFAISAAKEAGDLEAERKALEMQGEVLNVSAWERIIGGIPFANVVKEAMTYVDAAKVTREGKLADFERRTGLKLETADKTERELLDMAILTETDPKWKSWLMEKRDKLLAEEEAAREDMRTFRGVERTEEDTLIQEKSFLASQEKIEEEQLQKERELKEEERAALSAERAKMRSQVGIGALSRPPVEQKKRREPTKLKFGL